MRSAIALKASVPAQAGVHGKLFVAQPPLGTDGIPRIRRLLIANRGEIACRIIESCRVLGITSISIFTEEDRESLHVQAADEAISIGSIDQSAGNPHQNAELLVQTALSVEADAIHPGYGYLSENADFARAVQKAQILWVGPSPDTISILGDKRQAKDFLLENVPEAPLIPGYNGDAQNIQELEKQAAKIGYPVLIKAAAGGGGRGLRVVHSKDALKEELSRAQSEAQRSFGSAYCLLEKFIENSKHIEIQIMGDSSGEVQSLFDRECSVQRRYQKIIEEAPSPWLSDDLRHKMVEAAKAIGRSMQYENAGTVEFIVDVDAEKFYFLEVNTRIQVEHAITEETTGVDIVALQLFVAAGGLLKDCEPLSTVSQLGHSIECRVCAEDPSNEFMPDSGLILRWTAATDLLDARQRVGVRVETAIQTSSKVSSYFDSMIAKVIVTAVDRPSAIRKMLDVLRNTICVGIKTNISYLQACLLHPDFQKIDYTTKFLVDRAQELLSYSPAGNLQTALESFCFAPALLARFTADRSLHQSTYSPFRSIRRGFRNQMFDASNIAADVVTTDDQSTSPNDSLSMLLIWRTTRQIPSDTYYYQRRQLTASSDDLSDSEGEEDSKDSKAGIDLIRHYNNVFTSHFQGFHKDLPENTIRMVHSKIEQHESGSQKWITCDQIVEHNGKKHRLHLTTNPDFDSKGAGMPQRVFIHTQDLGCPIAFSRYTLLAYGESLRARFGISKEEDELRVYKSFMPCKILQIVKKKGDSVKKGETMLVVESMKTEVKVVANLDGTFEPHVAEGDAVEQGKVLCEIS